MLGFVLLADESTRFLLPAKDELIFGSLAFLLLLFVLLKFAFPKMKESLAARAARIRESIDSADNAKVEADRVLAEYRAQLQAARGDAQKIIEEAKRTAETMRQEMVQRAEAEAQGIVQRAKADVGGERDRAIQELRSTIGDLSLTLASRIIERELSNPESQRAFVQRSIDELATIGNAGSSDAPPPGQGLN